VKNDRIGHAESELTKKSNSDSLCCQESDSDSTQKPPTPDDPESATLLSGAQTAFKGTKSPPKQSSKPTPKWITLNGRPAGWRTVFSITKHEFSARRCQAKFLTSAKFLTCYCFSVILRLRRKKNSLAITFLMCVV